MTTPTVSRSMRRMVRRLALSLGVADDVKQAWVESRMLGERAKFLVRGRPEPSEAIVFVSSGRSGSTWFAELLATSTACQQIFEPLHPNLVPEAGRLTRWVTSPSRYRSFYLPPDAESQQWHDFLERVLRGHVRNYWTDAVRTSYLPNRYLIKLIRGNLLIGYLCRHFNPYVLYLTRHPCAVVSSRIKVGWTASIADLLCQERLVEDYLSPWVAEIERERDPVGIHAIWWAVENAVAQRELSRQRHSFVSYEAVVLDPQSCLATVSSELGLQMNRVSPRLIATPSRMSGPDFSYRSNVDRLSAWQSHLSSADQLRVLTWAARFGLSDYDLEPLPRSVREDVEKHHEH